MMAIKSIASRHTQDGSTSEIIFKDEDGTESAVRLRGNQWPNFISGVLREMGVAQKIQTDSLKGADRRGFWLTNAPRVLSFRGAVTRDGVPVLTLVLGEHTELDLSLSEISIPALIEWLSDLEEERQATPEPSQPN